MKNYFFALVLILSSISGFTQDSLGSRASSISLNFSGVPTAQISGPDTTYQNSLSISPVLDLRSKSGWGITYSPGIITSGKKPGIYMHTISAGYDGFGKRNFGMSFNYSHFFFTNKTSVPYSPIKNEIFISFGYSRTWLKPLFIASIGFGKDSGNSVAAHEIGLAGGISHDFGWKDKSIFSYIGISPSLMLNAATNEYFSFLRASKYISNSINFPKYLKSKTKSGDRQNLSLSNIELNLATDLEKNSFSIHPTASIFLPVSSGTDNSPYGYWQVSLQYHF